MSNFITRVPSRKVEAAPSGGKFVDLLVDGNFKLIFANPRNKPLLIGLLNAYLPDMVIEDLTLVQQEHRGHRPGLKSSVFDLYCRLQNGRNVVIEVQYNPRPDYLDRMLYYSTWPITEQKQVTEKNYRLDDVIVISFCNFALEHDSTWPEDRYISSYSLREDSTGELMTTALRFVYVELGRFNKTEDCNNTLDEWLTFYLKNLGRLNEKPRKTGFEIVDKLLCTAIIESLDSDERDKYDHNMRNEFDIRTEKIYAREEGKAEGKAEAREEIAKEMLKDGIDISAVAKYSGLTLEQVKTL